MKLLQVTFPCTKSAMRLLVAPESGASAPAATGTWAEMRGRKIERSRIHLCQQQS